MPESAISRSLEIFSLFILIFLQHYLPPFSIEVTVDRNIPDKDSSIFKLMKFISSIKIKNLKSKIKIYKSEKLSICS